MMLEAEKLCAWYGAAQILFDLSLTVGEGEVVALMGRNGSGKTTTMKAIMGLVGRRAGNVRFDGRDLMALKTFQIARLGIGWVPKTGASSPSLRSPRTWRSAAAAPMDARHGRSSACFSFFPTWPRCASVPAAA